MKDDPAITAIREARHRISAEVQHDPKKLVEYYMKLQDRHRERLIRGANSRSRRRGTDEVVA